MIGVSGNEVQDIDPKSGQVGQPMRLQCIHDGMTLIPKDATDYPDADVLFGWTIRYYGRPSGQSPNDPVDLESAENKGRLAIDPRSGRCTLTMLYLI